MSRKKGSEKGWCVYCGIQTPSGAAFCPRCGEPIDSSYVYGESISSEEALIEEPEETRKGGEITPIPLISGTPSDQRVQVLYEGTIRGSVTGESRIIRAPLVGGSKWFFPIPYYGSADAQFVMKLEDNIEGVPDELLVQTKFGYFGMGDKVTLQGRIFKINLRQWNRPMYTVIADHYYNESLGVKDGLLTKGNLIFRGMIRGSVAGESRPGVLGHSNFFGTYFVINTGIRGVPNEILVCCNREGYFGIGDKVILQGRILETNLKRWEKPMYVVIADHYYNESLQIGDDESVEGQIPRVGGFAKFLLLYKKRELYKGVIRGTLTREPRTRTRVRSAFVWGTYFVGNYFAMKLERDIPQVPDEILVQTSEFGYFGIGDKVILQGRILETNLKRWEKPMYVVIADHYYNESLQIGDVGLALSKRVFVGMIRGSVTGESRTRFLNNGNFAGTYFAMKLEGNIGIKGLPEEILVESKRPGYFRKGDEVILQGRILEINLKPWKKMMYVVIADHYYNESLQIGDA